METFLEEPLIFHYISDWIRA